MKTPNFFAGDCARPRLWSVALTWLVMAYGLVATSMLLGGETLYNGVQLPEPWPPRMQHLPEQLPTPPYLLKPPRVIPIDIGRQLFVDDFLIESTTMKRRFHKARYHPANPIIEPDKPWEMSKALGGLPTASPYSGGVWFDPQQKKFRMWYMGGYIEHLCLAESLDGIHWNKPKLDVEAGTNIVLRKGATESNSLIMDLNEKDPGRRFKYFLTNIGKGWKTEYRYSADGVHWSNPAWLSGPHGDRTTVFFNPFRKRWVFALRASDRSGRGQGRAKKYWETADINDASSVQWPASQPGRFDATAPLWVSADRGLDFPRTEVGIAPQLYHLDCVAYESLMIGMFNVLRGDFHENDGEGRDAYPGRPKCVEICLGYSRDGFHWRRPTHETFAGISEKRGDWNWGNVQSAGNSFIVSGDHLYFYVSGRKGAPNFRDQSTALLNAAYAGCSTGLAVLRRDGFASMGAEGVQSNNGPTEFKTLTTRSVRFAGSQLFVNVDSAQGELRVEVLDAQGQPIPGFAKDRCRAVRANKTLQRITWDGKDDLSSLAGQPVKFRFHLRQGRLFSFWVSKNEDGASGGFVAGGGPGFSSHRDTAGRAAYVQANKLRQDAAPAEYQPLVSTSKSAGATAATQHPKTSNSPAMEGLVVWLKADELSELKDGAEVIDWLDASPNKMDCGQNQAAARPRWVANAIGGRPAVRFDGVDDHLQFDHYPGLFHTFHQSTIFAVVSPGEQGGAIVSQAHANLSLTARDGRRLVFGSAYRAIGGETLWPQITSKTLTSPPQNARQQNALLCTLVRSGHREGETILRINGRRVDQGQAMPYHKTSPIGAYLGCAYRNRHPWQGDIAELLVYGRALSIAEQQTIRQYLADKYGLEAQRP